MKPTFAPPLSTSNSSPASNPEHAKKPRRVGNTVRGRFAFAKEFLKEPKEMAAVAPSSRHLARKMVEGIDFAHAGAIVEYGPGLGTFSRAVIDGMHLAGMSNAVAAPAGIPANTEVSPSAGSSTDSSSVCRFIAIERNERMSELFRQRFSVREATLYNDDAANVRSICELEGVSEVGYVVSGLGWPSFSDDLRERILVATADILRPGGEFRTFGYHVGLTMRGAWHFRRLVRELFREVTISSIVWRNMPPAFVYRCVK